MLTYNIYPKTEASVNIISRQFFTLPVLQHLQEWSDCTRACSYITCSDENDLIIGIIFIISMHEMSLSHIPYMYVREQYRYNGIAKHMLTLITGSALINCPNSPNAILFCKATNFRLQARTPNNTFCFIRAALSTPS